MKWPWSKPADVEERSVAISVADPAFIEFFDLGNPNYSGVTMNEQAALGIPAFWRAVVLISQTIASLWAGAVEERDDGTKERVPSWFDNPWSPAGTTAFEFWETTIVHLLVHGNAFLLHIVDGAGRMRGMIPVHPTCVTVEWDPTSRVKTYKVQLPDGKVAEYSDLELTHIPYLSTDGIRGLSVIAVARNNLGVAVAGDRAAAGMYANGMMLSGLITPEEDMDPDEAKEIAKRFQFEAGGVDNAGRVAVINRQLKFAPMTQTMADAQFLESRQFSVEEISRWTGVPPHLLMQTEKQTSWGTGVAEQNRGLSRTVLGPITRRLEDRLSRSLAPGRRLQFDFYTLEKPTPEQELDSLLKQVAGGLITVNEARAVRNLPPVADGDTLYQPAGSVGSTDEIEDGSPQGDPGKEGVAA